MFDFAQLDTLESSNEGVKFPILDFRTGEETGSFAVMYGPDSDQYRKATFEKDKAIMNAHNEEDLDPQEVEHEYIIRRLVSCTIRLIGCKIGEKHYTDDPDDILEFYTRLPFIQTQLSKKINLRTNFLPSAEKAGSNTSSKKHG